MGSPIGTSIFGLENRCPIGESMDPREQRFAVRLDADRSTIDEGPGLVHEELAVPTKPRRAKGWGIGIRSRAFASCPRFCECLGAMACCRFLHVSLVDHVFSSAASMSSRCSPRCDERNAYSGLSGSVGYSRSGGSVATFRSVSS